MGACGYVCPACEGRGLRENGQTCEWCQPALDSNQKLKPNQSEIKEEEWMKQVHEGPCCGDWEKDQRDGV